MMYYTSTLLSLFLFSLVSSSPTCEECQEAYRKLVTRLLTEESLQEQMDILKSGGCAVLEDPEACNSLVETWWGTMAAILYPNLMDPLNLCTLSMACMEEVARDWTCEDCVGGLEFASGYFESEEIIEAAIEILSGDSFCGAPGATEDCPEQMAAWLPVAIPILSAAIRTQEMELCHDEVGVC